MKKVYAAILIFSGLIDVIEVFEDEKEAEQRLLDQSIKDGYKFKTYNDLEFYMHSDDSLKGKYKYVIFETELRSRKQKKL